MNSSDSGQSDRKKEVAAMLRSVIQSSKGGVHIGNLNKEYMMLVGESIPFRSLGYNSLRDLLNSMPDVVRIRSSQDGEDIVQAVADEATAHIASLVARQKSAKPKLSLRKPIRRPTPRPHAWNPPHRVYGAATPWSTGGHRVKSHPPPSHVPPGGPPHHPKHVPKRQFQPIPKPARQPSPPQVASKYNHNYQIPPRFQKIREPIIPNFTAPVENNVIRSPTTPPPLPNKFSKEEAEEEVARKAVAALKIGQGNEDVTSDYDTDLSLDNTNTNSPPHALEPVFSRNVSFTGGTVTVRLSLMGSTEPGDVTGRSPISRYDTPERREKMLARIVEIVAPHEKGLWSHQVPVEYESKHAESLPEEWLRVVGKYCKNIDVNPVPGYKKAILYYKEKKQENHQNQDLDSENMDLNSPLNGSGSHDDSETSSLESTPESLVLPENQYWDVFLSYAVSTMYVMVRLVDYSEKYEELTAEMDQYYTDHRHPLSEVVKGALCAVKVDDTWHRVQVVNIIDNKRCEGYFVDHGDTDVLLNSQLHELDPRFLTIPFQALRCQLAGLEELSENPVLIQPLSELLGKTLVAEVVNREDPMSVIFYDTSTDEDVNINEHLLDIAAKTPIGPILPKVSGIANVRLTHVSSDGEIFVQIDGPHEKHLYMLQNELAIACETSKTHVTKPQPKKIYAVKYDDGGWYRAMLTEEQPSEKNKFQVMFIDYGDTSIVSPELIREVDILEKPKFNMSPQAVKCCLHGVPPDVNLKWTDQATQKLNSMASVNVTLLLKVVSAPTVEKPAQVELFKRIEPNDELVSINQTLALNADLFRLILSKDSPEKRKKARVIRRRSPSQSKTSSRSTPDLPDSRPGSLTLVSLSDQSTTPEPVSPSPESPFSKAHDSLPLPTPEGKKDAKSSSFFALASPEGISEGSESASSMPPIRPPTIPNVGGDFDIHVTLAANPNNFVCQPWANGKQLDHLMDDMQVFYSNEENIFAFHEFVVEGGAFYACKHIDGNWYRTYVQDIVSHDPFMVSAYFVDYGDLVMVELSDIQPLWRQFRELPFQAIRAALAGIEAKDGDWSPNDCVTFQNLIVERQFVALVKGKSVDQITENIGGVRLDLELIDTTDPAEDVYVAQLLKERGIAKTTKNT